MRSDEQRLADIIKACPLALEFLGGLSAEAFVADERTHSAVVCQVIFLGEASKGLSSELREYAWHVDFGEAAAMRDVLVHNYYRLDLPLFWKTVSSDLPPLLRDCEAQLERLR